MPRKVNITWDGVESACHTLSDILRRESFSGILAVTRGGLIPAGMLSYELRLPVLGIIDLNNPAATVVPFGKQILIVDDICDTGKTFHDILSRITALSTYSFAAPFVKSNSVGRCFWSVCVPQDTWLVFPWAKNDEVNR